MDSLTNRDYFPPMTRSSTLTSSLGNDRQFEAGRMELERIPLSLHELLRQALALMRVPANEKCTALTLDIDPDSPDKVMGDPVRLTQVCRRFNYAVVSKRGMLTSLCSLVQVALNLISNAIKFSSGPGRSGQVCVRLLRRLQSDGGFRANACSASTNPEACPSAAKVSVTALDSSSETLIPPGPRCCVRLEVEDNGVGVPPDVLSRLFSPFTQVTYLIRIIALVLRHI